MDSAILYGKIIINERYLFDSEKTFKPLRLPGVAGKFHYFLLSFQSKWGNLEINGHLGGQKYIVQNILFKFCTDHVGLFGSDHFAQKLAAHELRGLINIFNVGYRNGLCVPMMTVIDYKGNISNLLHNFFLDINITYNIII